MTKMLNHTFLDGSDKYINFNEFKLDSITIFSIICGCMQDPVGSSQDIISVINLSLGQVKL